MLSTLLSASEVFDILALYKSDYYYYYYYLYDVTLAKMWPTQISTSEWQQCDSKSNAVLTCWLVEHLLTVTWALSAMSLCSLPDSDTSSSTWGLDASLESSLAARRRFFRWNNRAWITNEHRLHMSTITSNTHGTLLVWWRFYVRLER